MEGSDIHSATARSGKAVSNSAPTQSFDQPRQPVLYRAMRCAVLRCRMLLCFLCAMCGTGIGYAATVCAVLA
eukprot:2368894-Rhodomonas_salina.1